MSALLIGFLLVVASAAVFGFALFGPRPIPQPAIGRGALQRDPDSGAENQPRGHATATSTPSQGVATGTNARGVRLRAADVRPSRARRIRAVGLLTVSVVGSAVLIGAVLSLIAVGAILIIS
jgi:hypothetical protein